jgi:hypothetical protein
MGRTACREPQCLYKGALYLYLTVELYLYSSYGPYGLYRVSVPVQGCTLPLPYSRAIPLLPLWTVRPVQSLSACTRVHFNFTFPEAISILPYLSCVHSIIFRSQLNPEVHSVSWERLTTLFAVNGNTAENCVTPLWRWHSFHKLKVSGKCVVQYCQLVSSPRKSYYRQLVREFIFTP